MQTVEEILTENRRRHSAHTAVYEPLTGRGCGGTRVKVTDADGHTLWLPQSMVDDYEWPLARRSVAATERLRLRHDFEFWAARCVNIRHKATGRTGPLVLNSPQRRVLQVLEEQRLAGTPLRIIILKARQWGGSTLVQCYMAWIQTVHRRNWNSYICAHVKDTASAIRGMFTAILDRYPPELWDGDEGVKPQFRPFERSQNVREIAGRGCVVSIGSAEMQEASRGTDFAMAHLSEVGFWKSTTTRAPEDLVRAICSGIALVPYSFIAMESTANGVGTFFHREWLRAEAGDSDKAPVFVPWHEIESYTLALPGARETEAFIAAWDDYQRAQWHAGLTLEQMWWYHRKRLELGSLTRMMAEYPATPVEAFAGTGAGVFAVEQVEAMRRGCRPPVAVGEVSARGFAPDRNGCLQVWQMPSPDADYVAVTDVGGRSHGADWSVITVMRRRGERGLPEVVAQWRGHLDHDLLAQRAAHLAQYYNQALLVVESNTLETESYDQPSVILHRLASAYPHLYHRQGAALRPGFHTNTQTKAAALDALIAAVRDSLYTERCDEALNELITYERMPNGACAARRGCHDDMLMTRAIALYILAETQRSAVAPPPPRPARSWF